MKKIFYFAIPLLFLIISYFTGEQLRIDERVVKITIFLSLISFLVSGQDDEIKINAMRPAIITLAFGLMFLLFGNEIITKNVIFGENLTFLGSVPSLIGSYFYFRKKS